MQLEACERLNAYAHSHAVFQRAPDTSYFICRGEFTIWNAMTWM